MKQLHVLRDILTMISMPRLRVNMRPVVWGENDGAFLFAPGSQRGSGDRDKTLDVVIYRSQTAVRERFGFM